ncbi:MAG: peptide deformylase [Desulfitobacteriaceae bacterium]|nr:peptide deformylase [Desulfitobacteriaceae bacterium]MDI6879876.1 peptide deformylase [Desulfitobacteriaceae bacterium]MDI6914714.1 peptide deformylase [Desulfitobacteriaceae bacterium]
MAVYQIVEIGADVLREKAKIVSEITPNIEKLLENMADTMYAAEGIGLAAPQIGISKQVIVVNVGEGLVELINPAVVEQSEDQDVETEGCLSIPGVTGDVVRAARVRVQGLNRQGEAVDIQAEGLFARALQHEIDHLAGVLFVDKARKTYRK